MRMIGTSLQIRDRVHHIAPPLVAVAVAVFVGSSSFFLPVVWCGVLGFEEEIFPTQT